MSVFSVESFSYFRRFIFHTTLARIENCGCKPALLRGEEWIDFQIVVMPSVSLGNMLTL
jgi:hypothetical protein